MVKPLPPLDWRRIWKDLRNWGATQFLASRRARYRKIRTAPVRYYEMAARLREADVALDEARICADADGVRIRELVADRDREAVNREAVQRALADVVVERDSVHWQWTEQDPNGLRVRSAQMPTFGSWSSIFPP